MGFFQRLSNVISGKANKALDKLEDPIEQLDLAIRKKEEAVKKAKLESASFIGSVSTKNQEYEEFKKRINQYELGIRKAMGENNEAKAKELLMQKKSLDTQAETLNATIQTLEESTKKTKIAITSLEQEVETLKLKKKELSARYTTAQAQSKVNEILADVDKDASISIADIESKVNQAEAYASGLSTFAKKEEDAELKEYLQSSKDNDLDAELEKYR